VPARFSPVYGFEGANVLFDTWVHPLVMGLEEHLVQMFREDFEFHGEAAPSHLHGAAATAPAAAPEPAPPQPGEPAWTRDGELEMKKIPFFVRAKARRNTEKFAAERGVREITVETLYEAKAHYSR
jgi:light-independent protochlorophyllide reductase subunit B